MSNKNQSVNGIGFIGLLSLMFIAFKLLKVIEWSWVWVLSPLWMPTTIILIGALIYLTISTIIEWKNQRKKLK